jgi:hypothetical protein
MITYKQINWRHNIQIIRDRIYELEHLDIIPEGGTQLVFNGRS